MSSIGMIRGAWRFRGFVFASVKREFVARYLGTQLGFFWAIAHPLALVLIYTLVFAEIMKPTLPGHASRFAYSIYLTSGIIVWTLFSDVLNRSVGIFVHNANLLKKVSVPKITLPLIASFSALVHTAIMLAVFGAFLAATGNFPGMALAGILPVLAIVIGFAVGLGILLGTVNVFYRDVEQTVGLVVQFWFWLTPIVYPARALPEFMERVIAWNPVWPLVEAMQAVFLDGRFPDWSRLAYPALLAIGVLLLARKTFVRLSDELVDEL
jgi:lipopolysaccharide transport system permease protein